ncbi:2-hydroxychromene-2-carboxylate isomerase [Hellea balneolensis]|uniref:2-hydroxychromene-2-carboxylate isomerase n=1 Tax=Hellea balneolensis TaxID=287478 RepID=UPI00041CDE4B|nr:DsbA family protein [Hellea balneolensis]
MAEQVDVYWSFRSPYSYLVTPDLLKLKEDFDVDVNLRVVLPIAVRSKAALFDPSNMKPVMYILMDSLRRAEFLGMPLAFPRPDPVAQNQQTFEVSEDQPYIFWISKLGVEAQRQGKGIEFAVNVSRHIWGGTENWHVGDYLAKAAAEAGLDFTQMEKAIEGDTHLNEIEDNQKALDAAGHWGVPTMVVKGEPFFGQDRIDTLRWRLEKLGLAKA